MVTFSYFPAEHSPLSSSILSLADTYFLALMSDFEKENPYLRVLFFIKAKRVSFLLKPALSKSVILR